MSNVVVTACIRGDQTGQVRCITDTCSTGVSCKHFVRWWRLFFSSYLLCLWTYYHIYHGPKYMNLKLEHYVWAMILLIWIFGPKIGLSNRIGSDYSILFPILDIQFWNLYDNIFFFGNIRLGLDFSIFFLFKI